MCGLHKPNIQCCHCHLCHHALLKILKHQLCLRCLSYVSIIVGLSCQQSSINCAFFELVTIHGDQHDCPDDEDNVTTHGHNDIVLSDTGYTLLCTYCYSPISLSLLLAYAAPCLVSCAVHTQLVLPKAVSTQQSLQLSACRCAPYSY